MNNIIDFICGEVLAIGVASAQGALTVVVTKGILGVFGVTILSGTYGVAALVGAVAYGSFYSGMYANFYLEDQDEGFINSSSVLAGVITCYVGAYLFEISIITALALAALNFCISYMPILLSRINERTDMNFLTTMMLMPGLKFVFRQLRDIYKEPEEDGCANVVNPLSE